MKNQHKISDKRVVMAKVKVLIDTGKWEDLLAFVEKHQKNLKIPVELIANLLLQRKEGMWAMKMIARMPTKQKDEQYLLLQRIGCVKEAIDLAADRKDIDTLEDIANTLVSQELKTYLNEKLAVLRRR